MKIFSKPCDPSPLKQESEIIWSKRLGETTFRNDFRKHDVKLCYTKSIEPPAPARINISSDILPAANVEETYKSACKEAYENPNSRRQNQDDTKLMKSTYDKQAIYHTNFKMCVDRNLDGFSTTNHVAYPARKPISFPSCRDLSVLKLSTDPCSAGPLGAKVLDFPTSSEYLDSFRGIPTENRHTKVKRNLEHIKYPCHNMPEPYLTTSMDTFKAVEKANPSVQRNSLPHSLHLQQNRITSIPFGDKEKIHEIVSSSQDTYRNDNLSNQAGRQYSKINAHSSTYRSSFQLGDSGKIIEIRSTPLPFHKDAERRHPIPYERNASSFPQGDLNKGRVKERMSLLSSRNTHSMPPLDSYPEHINTSSLHTKSHIHLGHTKQIPTHESTMKTSYHPLSTGTVKHARASLKDNIPFDYSNDELCSTVKASYGLKTSKVNRLNKRVIDNLKKSHWELPNMGISAFLTTHQTSFMNYSIA